MHIMNLVTNLTSLLGLMVGEIRAKLVAGRTNL